ncbi:EamA family transporter [Thermoanaerobacterium thermosulfurigenes]|uniref:EamA family transporter n=1 Tax=Thermoanaerobacterium thermosulfurigenes TaxID=33950 RepID=UPI003EF190C2
MIYVLVAVNVLLLVTGQVLWKVGIGSASSFKGVLMSLMSPYVISGIIVYALATVLWLYILAKGKFSIVYPLQSTAYALGVFVAWLIFKETIPMTRWIGVVLIFAGASLIALR